MVTLRWNWQNVYKLTHLGLKYDSSHTHANYYYLHMHLLINVHNESRKGSQFLFDSVSVDN